MKINAKFYPFKEIAYQISLVLILFIGQSFDKSDPHLHWHEVLFLGNYVVGATIINYGILPFYYQKKYWKFTVFIVLIILIVILIEEYILEQIYFPMTRGTKFNLFYTLIDVMPVILILVGFKFAWDITAKEQELEKVKKLMIENQLQFLKSQVNPHFLFNNLNNIYAYALENSPKTPEIILELSTVLRYMIYDCREDFVLINKELEYLKHYVNLHKLQMETRGKVELDIQNTNYQNYIAPLILIVFVENAFKHSLSSQINDIQIVIKTKIEENQLFFECQNTFLLQTNTQHLHQGIGLKNVISRLELLYPDNYKLEIDNSDNWYKVALKINLKND